MLVRRRVYAASIAAVTDAGSGAAEDWDIYQSVTERTCPMIIRSRYIAVLTTVVALSSVASASAVAKSHGPTKSSSHTKVPKRMSASRAKGIGVVKPIKTAGPSVAAISAFPTGGKGSGTEATCALWSDRLQEDQQIIDNAPETDKDDASGPLNTDIDNALDAGCAVIY